MANQSKVDTSGDIFRFKDVKLTLRGAGGVLNPPVSAITIDLQENAIPSIIFVIDPNPAHDGGTTEAPDASSASLGELKSWGDAIQKHVNSNTSTADFSMTVVDVNGKVVQNVSVSGWMLAGGGISDVSAAGGFALGVTIQHPAGMLDRSCSVLGSIGTMDSQYWKGSGTDDVISAFAGLTTRWAEVPRMNPPRQMADYSIAITAMRRRLIKAADSIRTNLVFTSGWPGNAAGYTKWPFNSYFSDANQKLVLMSQYVESVMGSSSVWENFASVLGNEFFLSIIPTYWDKLKVVPFTPWGMPCITLWDDEVAHIEFPPSDPMPVAGARVGYTGVEDNPDCSSLTSTEDIKRALVGQMMYMPPAARSGEVVGRFVEAQLPPIIDGMVQGLTANTAEVADNGLTAFASLEPGDSPAMVSGLNPVAGQQLDQLTHAAAHQYFLAAYRSQLEIVFSSCLLMQSAGSMWDNGYVVPGSVVRIKSRSDDRVLLDFYLKRVIHTISIPTHEARTEWIGSHVRPAGGITGMASNGEYNPVYEGQAGQGLDASGSSGIQA